MYERLAVSEKQNVEINKLMKAFEDNQIQYMPLKGVLLQELYPARDMRFMADFDVLINVNDYDKIEPILEDLGYEFDCESDHEYNFVKKPFIHVELHKHLIPSYDEDMYEHFGDGWELAHLSGESKYRYELTTEDNYLYIFTHFAKHYRDTGCGIRLLIDIWLYMKKYSDMDMDYIQNQLLALNLFEFHKNCERLIKAWFEDGEFDDITKHMTEFIVNSGTFGSRKNQISANTIRDYMDDDVSKAEKQKYIKLLFPDLKNMSITYPVLEKHSYLLPIFWLIRLVKAVLFKRKNIRYHRERTDIITDKNIEEYDNHMKAVGLDIYNGRKKS